MPSFAQKIATDTQRQNIYLVTGGRDHTGRAAWYYIRVDDHQRARFERVVRSGALTLTEYGTILESGYGDTPPESVRNRMKIEHGFTG